MSSETLIIPQIIDLVMMLSTLSQLKVQYEEAKKMATCDGIVRNVEVVITDPNGRKIGLEKAKNGTYHFVADNAGLDSQQLKIQKDFLSATH